MTEPSPATALTVLPADAHNAKLVAHLHPPDWVNPTPADSYNMVVLGGGTAGLIAALGAAGLGAKVALVEKHLLGGDCLNFGCVPSKGVLAAGHMAHEVRARAPGFGITATDVRVDAAVGLQRMRRIRADIAPHDGAARIRDAGVDVFLGEGRFTSSDTLQVGEASLRFKRAVLATGARPFIPPIEGIDVVKPRTSDTIFELETAPARLLVLGGGPIGCELAQAFSRLGSRVTLLEFLPTIMANDDPDAAALVRQRFDAEGIDVRTGFKVVDARMEGPDKVLVAEDSGGQRHEFRGDEVLAATGRRARTEGLGLESAGVKVGDKGPEVDARLQTTNPRIYVAGDAAGSWQFTHAADAHARIVLRNAFFFGRSKHTDLVMPWATYTDPEVAHVGVSHEQAAEQGLTTLTVQMADVDRAKLEGRTEGFARLYVDAKGKLKGATAVHSHAGDLIGEAALAISAGLGAGDLAGAIHPYPTTAEVWKKLGDQYQRTRLTPFVAGLFERWFRFLR